METTTEQNITITAENGVKELVIRHGKALELKQPVAIKLEGTISAPRDFFLQRMQHKLIDLTRALVKFSRTRKHILFWQDPTDTEAAMISGMIHVHPDLAAFDVNGDRTFELSKMRDFLRVRRHLFANSEEHNKAMETLKKFSAKLSTEIRNENDSRGNTNVGVSTVATTEVPTDFTLKMPLFIGGEAETFKVEIAFEMRSAGASFWFISTELPELLEKRTSALLEQELSVFREAGCAVLEV